MSNNQTTTPKAQAEPVHLAPDAELTAIEMGSSDDMEQAAQMGITPQDMAKLQADLASGDVTYQQILGLTDQEMAAMAYRAEEHLRHRKPTEALKIYLALVKLNRFDGDAWRGCATCFHMMREYGYAHGYYGMALAVHADDRISEAMRAECTLKIDGHVAASHAIDALLQKPPSSNPLHAPYVERARQLQLKLLALPR
jgi:tetratricopeptide (TPR) repeat protein